MTDTSARWLLWKQLIKQDELEAQYEVLLRHQVKHVYTNKEVAMHLARFAEARIFVSADRHSDGRWLLWCAACMVGAFALGVAVGMAIG